MSSIIKEGHQVAEASGIQFPHTIVDDIMQIMPAILIIWGQVCITI